MMTPDREDAPLIWRGHPDWAEYVFLWFFSVVFAARAGLACWMGQRESAALFAFGVGLFVGAAVFLRQRTYYEITRQGVYKSKGIWGKTSRRLPLIEMREIKIRQGPMDRLFGIGSILLEDKTGKVEFLIGIRNPEIVNSKIKALI